MFGRCHSTIYAGGCAIILVCHFQFGAVLISGVRPRLVGALQKVHQHTAGRFGTPHVVVHQEILAAAVALGPRSVAESSR